ncbi:type III glutamate--ammonia ligase [soil metagenome]
MKTTQAIEDLRQRLEAQGVHTLIAQFTDVNGVAKGKLVPLAHLATLLGDGAGFSGASIWGTGLPRMGPRSEYYGRGDPGTAVALPWMPGYARVACDGFVAGEVFDACPRQVLRRQIARLAERGWHLQTGIEPEFFLLKRANAAAGSSRLFEPADANDQLAKPSYDLKSLPRQHAFLAQLADGLNACGLDVFQIDHEDAHSQFELNFMHAEALVSADRMMLFKMAAQALAEAHGMVFSMMPKPFADQPGSGMHFHVSLWEGSGDGARCVFDAPASRSSESPSSEPAADSRLSPIARHFIAGVLAHSAALCAIAAPTVNSYKRLVVGESISGTSWAPAYVAHGPNNRTALVRTLAGRFEWRLPDASANPYLATAALIAAGLDGIDRPLDPGPACTDDLFELSLADIARRGIEVLPQNLGQAIDALAQDEVICTGLGDTLATQFITLKRAEWIEYSRHVSGWEMERYAAMF